MAQAIKQGRNDRCACGSGRKFKQCCAHASQPRPVQAHKPATAAVSIDTLLTHGVRSHQTGDLPSAAALYEQALTRQPDNIDALHLLGIARREQGRTDEAVRLLQRVTTARPRFAEAHCNLGVARHAQGRLDDAVTCHRRAIDINPKLPEPWLNLGNAFNDLGRADDALVCYERALALRAIAGAHQNAGNILLAKGRLDEAIEHFQRALRIDPNRADVHTRLGTALHQRGQFEEAIRAYDRAIAVDPACPQAHNNRGNVLRDLNRHHDAMACYLRALELDRTLSEAHNNLGNLLCHFGEVTQAEACLQRALQLSPDLPQAHCSLGSLFKAQNRLAEAESCYRRAIALQSEYAPAHNNLGVTLTTLNRHDEAIAALRHAIALRPEFAEAYCNLGNAYKDQGRLDLAVESYSNALRLDPGYSDAHSNLLFAMNYMDEVTPEAIHARHVEFAERYAAPFSAQIAPHANSRDPTRALRVGYVSPDLRNHACAMFIEPLLAHHDRGAVEIYVYAEVVRPDEVTARLRALAPNWRSTVGLEDEALAELIRRDRIDILVDLAGHTARNRLLVFARKPAPVQVTYLGYPATTGLTTMDYRLTDNYTEPAGLSDRYYTEQLVRLPNSLWCYRPPQNMPEVSALPALSNGHLTFGSFNNFAKVGPRVLRLWARILAAIPESRLIMLTVPDGSARQQLLAQFVSMGIDAERIELMNKLPREKYLEVYSRVDIALDPFPCNGGTTSCDSLWMGVPVLTLIGETFLSRAGYSLLSVAGLPEFAAATDDDYTHIAERCANDVNTLAATRARLRERLRASPLMNEAQFARDVEAAYRDLWQRWCAKRSQS